MFESLYPQVSAPPSSSLVSALNTASATIVELSEQLKGRFYEYCYHPCDEREHLADRKTMTAWKYSGSGTWHEGWDLLGLDDEIMKRLGRELSPKAEIEEMNDSDKFVFFLGQIVLMSKLLYKGTIETDYGEITEASDEEDPQIGLAVPQ